jgi:hypothetical protein
VTTDTVFWRGDREWTTMGEAEYHGGLMTQRLKKGRRGPRHRNGTRMWMLLEHMRRNKKREMTIRELSASEKLSHKSTTAKKGKPEKSEKNVSRRDPKNENLHRTQLCIGDQSTLDKGTRQRAGPDNRVTKRALSSPTRFQDISEVAHPMKWIQESRPEIG